MENHPIPQDVTGFQFRLIGDMTVKQFAYIAVCAVIGWFFLFILPLPGLLKLPLSIGAVAFGIALAFIPVEGRPLDQMTLNFLKDLFVPNQYLYHKKGGTLVLTHLSKHALAHPVQKQQTSTTKSQDLEQLLNQLHNQPQTKLDEKESAFLNALSTAFSQSQQKPEQVIVTPIITSVVAPVAPQMPPQPQEQKEEKQTSPTDMVKQLPPQEKPKAADTQPAVASPIESQKEQKAQNPQPIPSTASEKQRAADALRSAPLDQSPPQETIQVQTQPTPAPIAQPSAYFSVELAAPSSPPSDKQLIQELTSLQKNQGYTTSLQQAVPGAPFIPDVPNLISGIVKDPRGNILNNILIEIKDKEGNPVRAFKTNALGQFASATPLLNGSYTIEFEDPKGTHRFSQIELNLTGQVVMPFEVISTDAREELRQSLFGTQPTKPN